MADVYLEYAGWAFLVVVALLTVLLAAAGGGRLARRWWVGSAVSGAIVIGLSLVVVLALGALDDGGAGLSGARWELIGLAGVIGFVAGTDVQLILAIVGRGAHAGAVTAGAVVGPALVVGGYLLLQRTLDWIRLAAA